MVSYAGEPILLLCIRYGCDVLDALGCILCAVPVGNQPVDQPCGFLGRHAVFHYPSSCHKTRKVFAVVFSLAVIILYNIARYISIGIVDKNIVRYMCKIYIAHYNGGVVY